MFHASVQTGENKKRVKKKKKEVNLFIQVVRADPEEPGSSQGSHVL